MIQSGKMAPMANHPHTIDRWDDATGENVIEQIAKFGDYMVARRCNAGLKPKSRAPDCAA